MSLKAVHLAFIFVSAVLAGGFSLWCFREMSQTQSLGAGAAGAVSAAATIALGVYAVRFLKKSRGVSYL